MCVDISLGITARRTMAIRTRVGAKAWQLRSRICELFGEYNVRILCKHHLGFRAKLERAHLYAHAHYIWIAASDRNRYRSVASANI